MRQVATIADERQARQLADYLLTQEITTRVDPSPGGWIVWIHREDKLDQARQEVSAFLADPDNPKYAGVSRAADAARRELERREREHRRKSINLSGRLNVPSATRCPVTYALIALSVGVAILSGLGTNMKAISPFLIANREVKVEYREVSVDPADEEEGPKVRVPTLSSRSTGLKAVREGQVWRLITPIFLHFGMMHLVFNMLWLQQLGGLIELRKGRLTMVAIVLISAVVSNLGQFFWDMQAHGPEQWHVFGGMSGVVFALFGYCWMKSDYDPASDIKIPSNSIVWMLLWLVVCMTGAVGPIANAAHLAGLGVGMVIGFAPHLLRDW